MIYKKIILIIFNYVILFDIRAISEDDIQKKIEYSALKSENLLLDVIENNDENGDLSIENIIIFAHGTVKFVPNQIHDEYKDFIHSRKLFYDIRKNLLVNCGKGKNRLELNKIEVGFRGEIPGLVEIDGNNSKKEMNSETLETIFKPIQKNSKKNTKFFLFNWTGGISNTTRTASAFELVCTINELKNKYPHAKITYFGHSHGGTIACEAANICHNLLFNGRYYNNFLYNLKHEIEFFLKDKENKILPSIMCKNLNNEYTEFKNNIHKKNIDLYFLPQLNNIKFLINNIGEYDDLNCSEFDLRILKEKLSTLNNEIKDILQYEKKFIYNHDNFLDRLICVGSPMPAERQLDVRSKNLNNEYLIKTVISFSSHNDTVVDPYIGFPSYTSNKFYIKRPNQFNFIFNVEKNKEIYSLNHHDIWFNELLGESLKSLIPQYINFLCDENINAYLNKFGPYIELKYNIDTKEFIFSKIASIDVLFEKKEEIFFSRPNIFTFFGGILRFMKTLIWDMGINKRIESKYPLKYYKG